MKFQGLFTALFLLSLVYISSSQIYSRKRLVSSVRKNPFTLTARKPKTSSLRYRGRFTGNNKSRVPDADALRGQDGSYDFNEESNAILQNKVRVKPTKTPTSTTTNPNKINIESRLPAVTVPRTKIERANVGGTAILHCYFDEAYMQSGIHKNPQIWWTKQPQRSTDRPIILGAGTQIRLPDDRLKLIHFAEDFYSILIIRDVLMTDAGEYKCSLPTVTGTQTEFASLTVYDPDAENIETSSEENIGEIGGTVDLYCRPEKPGLNVWWTAERLTGEMIEIEVGKRKVVGEELHLTNLRQHDTGVYTCHVQVTVGSPIQKEFTLKVKERPWAISAFNGGFNIDTFLSKFNKDPEYGEEVNLRCDSGGIPTPTIIWMFGSQELASSSKYIIKSHEPTYTQNAITGSLTIVNFSPEDEGRYHCQASNDMGTRRREFTVKGFHNRATEILKSFEDDEDSPSLESSASLAFGPRTESEEGSGEVDTSFI
ncbi:protein amalgam-like [Watersipora subatra]|uniref:protein amalgam-like n=1 Tax=Watersipora subatra TaxID=2589382 RepID=UPI00355BA556